MKKGLIKIVGLVAFLALTVNVMAQVKMTKEEKKIKKQADAYFEVGNYLQAFPLFKQLDSINSNSAEYKFKLGVSYLNFSGQRHKAKDYLEKAYQLDSKNNQVHFYLGRAYHLNHEFTDAIASYQEYLIRNTLDPAEEDKVIKMIDQCEFARMLVKDATNVHIENVGAPVNSVHGEHSPVMSKEQNLMVFTQRKPGNQLSTTDDKGKVLPKKAFSEELLVSFREGRNWTSPVAVSGEGGGKQISVGISPDGSKILYYSKEGEAKGALHLCYLEKGSCTNPEAVGEGANPKDWEGHSCFSPDGNSIYFASTYTDGLGGTDIYKIEKKEDGTWSAPVNMGKSVNTPDDEYAPFIHPDGRWLYFASKGQLGMGGYDLFRYDLSRGTEDAENKPINLGYPINSAADDIFFSVAADNRQAFFTSDRNGTTGYQDIFTAYLPEFYETLPVMVSLKGNTASGGFIDRKVVVKSGTDINKIYSFMNENPSIYAEVSPYDDAVTTAGVSESVLVSRAKELNEYFLNRNIGADRVELIEEISTPETSGELLAMSDLDRITVAGYASNTTTKVETKTTAGDNTTKVDSKVKVDEDEIKIKEETQTETADTKTETETKIEIENKGDFTETTVKTETKTETPDGTVKEETKTETVTSNVKVGDKRGAEPVKVETTVTEPVTTPDTRPLIASLSMVNFKFDSYELTPQAQIALEDVYKYLNENRGVSISVEGHADAIGDASYNQKLSERRAQSVVNYLVAKGLDATRFDAIGYGETKPIATNANAEGRRKNRRVEVRVKNDPMNS